MTTSLQTELDELIAAIEPLAGIDYAVPVTDGVNTLVELRCLVFWRSEMGTGSSDADTRRALYLAAEQILEKVRRRDWYFVSVPRIEFGGHFDRSTTPPTVIHECTVRLDLTR